jgi:hypothetical protein
MPGRLVVLAAFLMTGTSAAGRSPDPAGPAPGPKAAMQPPAQGHSYFSCRLRGGKIATVTGGGGRFVYRYGTARKPELTIVGTAAGRNLFKQAAVHGGTYDIQLRFVRGEHSYIVHSFPRSDIVDNVPRSGLMVFRGKTRISDRKCSPWAEISFGDFEDLFEVPDSPEGSPSAWED